MSGTASSSTVPMSPVTSAPPPSTTAAVYQGRPLVPTAAAAAAQFAAAATANGMTAAGLGMGLGGLGPSVSATMDPLTPPAAAAGYTAASIPLVVSSATSAYPSVVSPTGKLPSATPPQSKTMPPACLPACQCSRLSALAVSILVSTASHISLPHQWPRIPHKWLQ